MNDMDGRIRILKRINFATLVAVFEELHGEIKKRITEIPGKMSINAKEFLGFCQSCMGIKFELVLIEM
jgi:hypothetical protein